MSQKVFVLVSTLDRPDMLPEVEIIGVFAKREKAVAKADTMAHKRFANFLADYHSVDISELSEDDYYNYGWFKYDMSVGFSNGDTGIGFEIQISEEPIQ